MSATLVISAAASAAPTPVSGRVCCSGGSAYVVASGDSWASIALALGVEAGELADSNDATKASTLYPGDQLCLPAGADASAAAASAQRACRKGGGSAYEVEKGDSWFAIAASAAISMRTLLSANGATERRVLVPGDELCLPKGATLASTAGSTATGSASTQRGTSSTSSGSGSSSSSSSRSSSWNGVLDALPAQGPCWYSDTWHDGRGDGRVHEGVDLLAEEGRYVYAVADGVLTNRAWDQPGLRAGNAWWLTDADGTGTYYFYGHLYDFAQGLHVGSRVEAGEIIGFLGETGNAASPHLHFEIHPNGGGAINPYPIVKAAGGCKRGVAYQQPNGWIPETGGI